MKELCIDVRMGFHSGIGTYIRHLVTQLKEGPFKLILLANRQLLAKWPILSSFDLILTSAPIFSMEEQCKLPFLIPKTDIFWSPHYNIPLGYIRAKKRLVTIHDVYHLAYASALPFHKRLYAKIVINRAARLSDCIVTDSYFSQDEITKYTGVNKKKIEVVYLGVDHQRFTTTPDAAYLRSIQTKYQLPEKFFLFVSTTAIHKNIDRMLLAWNHIKNNHPEWKLIVVGKRTQNYWQWVFSQHPELEKHVVFLGEVINADLPAFYQLAEGLIHASLYEGFGLTPLEAMSSGCPVVVSNRASLPEVCGHCAIYVNPHHVEEIAAGMDQMIENPSLHAELSKQGVERSRQFTWEKTAQRYIEILERLI